MSDPRLIPLYGSDGTGQNISMNRALETIEIGAFGFALLAYSAAFVTVGSTSALTDGARDLRIILGLSAFCALASLVLTDRRPFLIFHSFRALLLAMAVATLGGRSPTVELLVLLPWLFETALYLPLVPGMVVGLSATAFVLGVDAMILLPVGPPVRESHLAFIGPVAGAALASGLLLTHYRNQLVKERVSVAKLRQDVDNLIRANQAFQDYADSIEAVTEENERNRITRELHDVIGYSLTNVIMMMNAGKVLSRSNPAQLDDLFQQAREHADEALQESRKILYALRAIQPTARKGLNAIHHLAQSFQGATAIRVDVAWGNLPQSLGADLDAALFRLVQEGMTNALRHGQAQRVRISFWRFPDRVQAQVWDNGKGVQTVTEGIGLSGMRERFALLGGTVTAEPVADGFLVTASIPLAQEWNFEP